MTHCQFQRLQWHGLNSTDAAERIRVRDASGSCGTKFVPAPHDVAIGAQNVTCPPYGIAGSWLSAETGSGSS